MPKIHKIEGLGEPKVHLVEGFLGMLPLIWGVTLLERISNSIGPMNGKDHFSTTKGFDKTMDIPMLEQVEGLKALLLTHAEGMVLDVKNGEDPLSGPKRFLGMNALLGVEGELWIGHLIRMTCNYSCSVRRFRSQL